MEEMPVPETRARSRSKTPFLCASVDRDIVVDGSSEPNSSDQKKTPIKKMPSVQTIAEENDVTPLSPSQKVNTKVLRQRTIISSMDITNAGSEGNGIPTPDSTSRLLMNVSGTKSAANVSPHNKLSDVAEEAGLRMKTISQMTVHTTTTTSKSSTNVTPSEIAAVAAKKSFTTSSNESAIDLTLDDDRSSGDHLREISQNALNNSFERSIKMKTSTPAMANVKRNLMSISRNVDLSQHIAYKEYKEAGDYSNKYPKTDYTYSQLSQHRRELAPGVIAMPNMSRRSLDKHHERVNAMAKRNPTKASFIRARYESSLLQRGNGRHLDYESQDEVDLSEFDAASKNHRNKTSMLLLLLNGFFQSIITTVFSCIYWASSLFRRSEQQLYYSQTSKKQGYFGLIAAFFVSRFSKFFRYVYLFLSSVLFADSWLLRSVARSDRKKRSLLALLVLLPLLLLGVRLIATSPANRMTFLSTSYIPLSLPLTLTTGVRKSLHNLGALANLNGLWSQPGPSTLDLDRLPVDATIDSNNKLVDLSAEDYANLLADLKVHFKTVLGDKAQRVESSNLALLIQSIIDKRIALHQPLLPVLSDAELKRITDIVLANVKGTEYDKDGADKFSEEVTAALVADLFRRNEETQADRLAERLTASDVFMRMVSHKLEEAGPSKSVLLMRQQLIEIRAQLLGGTEANEQLRNIINDLIEKNGNLVRESLQYRKRNDARMDELLLEIDTKFADSVTHNLNEIVDVRIRNIVNEILGIARGKGDDGGATAGSIINFTSWIENIFVAKDYLEMKLKELNDNINRNRDEEQKRASDHLMEKIGVMIKSEILQNARQQVGGGGAAASLPIVDGDRLTVSDVQAIVERAIAVYDADKTGLVDYALESAGGQILSTRCTENYHKKTAQISVFGIPLWYPSNTPRIAIAPSVQPGECWAFQGFPGFLVIKLNAPVYLTGFTIEHIPKCLSPNGHIDSAPKSFSVLGLVEESDAEPMPLGNYEYVSDGSSLQHFNVQNTTVRVPHQIVELRIESNHGNPQYTCLYRFRVHGVPTV